MLIYCIIFFILNQNFLLLSKEHNFDEIVSNIDSGNFIKTEKLIDNEKNDDNSFMTNSMLDFHYEKMKRISLDFSKNRKDVLKWIKQYIPNANNEMLDRWEKSGVLEFMIIEGEKRYFKHAAKNLFRIDDKCNKIMVQKEGENFNKKNARKYLIPITKNIIDGKQKQTRYRAEFSIKVNKNIVPVGETIRCWMPFPKEIPGRQENIQIISTFPDKYETASNNATQRSIYFEQKQGKTEAKFNVVYEYTSISSYDEIALKQIPNYDTNSEEYKKYTAERLPHIAFSEELIKLSNEIVGDETNPYLKAKLVFKWIDENIKWVAAREYSTITSLSRHCYEKKFGDCGLQSMLFITLCRIQGIPSKWQSGWYPKNMHDWSEILIPGYGWLPVDVSFGTQLSQDEKVKMFFFGNIDDQRLIINDDFSAELYPPKWHFRSETVDFQRGEVEWKGGNLYFNQWDYEYKIQEVKDAQK